MQHFPIFLDMRGARIVVSGAGMTAEAKLRLILKTEAHVAVYGPDPSDQIMSWHAAGRLKHSPHPVAKADVTGARLVYAANDDAAEDARVRGLAKDAGILANVVDNLDASDFITPAIVDRDPVTVAIGTEGTAPVLARKIKAEVEASLPSSLGVLARAANAFRPRAFELAPGAPRRAFWSRYFSTTGPRALDAGGEASLPDALSDLLAEHHGTPSAEGRVSFVGAGPGDPDLLTRKALRALHEADVVIHDRLVSAQVLELVRREAVIIEVGKTPYGKSWKQDDINAVLVEHAGQSHHVVRLKSGDPGVFGRLDEEMDALDAEAIAYEIVPGITSSAAAAADAKISLTQRGRNTGLTILTGHDVDGFAEADWRALAAPKSAAAIYMGVRAARFFQGRLLMHGANPDALMTIVENASRLNKKVVTTNLRDFARDLASAGIKGPAIIFFGIAPKAARAAAQDVETQLAEVL